jgi:hypothetical protein
MLLTHGWFFVAFSKALRASSSLVGVALGRLDRRL